MVRSLLIFLILIVFSLCFIQKYTRVSIPDYTLNGYTEAYAAPVFSFPGFFDGTFQDKLTVYLQENVGFKGYLIALKNQIDYSLFHQLNYTIEEGKDHQLFYWNHIDTHCGHPTLNEDSLQHKVEECIRLQKLLDTLHTKLFFVLAPGKPYYYEDKLPAKYDGCCRTDNDYTRINALLQKNGFEVLDFNAWFKDKRAGSPYPLFPKLGTHWSYYGATLAADSITRFVEDKLHTDLTDYSIVKTEVTDKARGKDKDLYDLLNILLPIQSDSLAYPEVKFKGKGNKPKLLLIGDSFNWTLVETKMFAQAFSNDSRFWFYKKQLYDLNGTWITDNPEEVNLYDLMKGTDVIIFLSTEALYHRFDHGLANALFSKQVLVDSLIRNR